MGDQYLLPSPACIPYCCPVKGLELEFRWGINPQTPRAAIAVAKRCFAQVKRDVNRKIHLQTHACCLLITKMFCRICIGIFMRHTISSLAFIYANSKLIDIPKLFRLSPTACRY